MSWEFVRFGDLYAVESRNGLTKPSKLRGSGFKMINMGELFANDRIYDIPMELVPLKESEKVNAKVECGDLLFARQSLVLEGAGKCSIVMETSPLTVFESHLIRVRLDNKRALPLFYYYYFKSPLSPIKSIVSQCAQAGIRASDLQELQVIFPPTRMQRKIADILMVYDNLIENNQKQIKLLEEAAQRLYKEWFVDLRFPGYENTPIVDGVPAGWHIAKLSDVATVNSQSISKQYSYEFIDYVDLSAVSNGRIESPTRFSIQEAPGRAKRVASDGDIIWGMVRPNLKSYALVLHPMENNIFSTDFAILSAKKVPFSFLYCHVTTDNFVSYLINCTNGAAYPAVKPIHFEDATLSVPSDDILNQFHRIAEPMYRKIEILEKQICQAKEARDRLLPKLMSGEIEVIP